MVIVHQRQVALRGQGTRGFVRDGDNILHHHFRQNRLFYRGGFTLKGKGGSRHTTTPNPAALSAVGATFEKEVGADED